MNRLNSFLLDETGAATVDWVVMTAASVAMGLAVMSYVRDGIEDLSNDIQATLSGISIKTSFSQWQDFRNDPDAELSPSDEAAPD